MNATIRRRLKLHKMYAPRDNELTSLLSDEAYTDSLLVELYEFVSLEEFVDRFEEIAYHPYTEEYLLKQLGREIQKFDFDDVEYMSYLSNCQPVVTADREAHHVRIGEAVRFRTSSYRNTSVLADYLIACLGGNIDAFQPTMEEDFLVKVEGMLAALQEIMQVSHIRPMNGNEA